MLKFSTCLFVSLLPFLWDRANAQDIKFLSIAKVSGDITIDGHLNEDAWKDCAVAAGFEKNFPDDSSRALYQTIVKIAYDETNLYLSAVLHRNPQRKYAVSSLIRDFTFYENDAFGVVLDPFNDRTNGFGFYVNAWGAVRDEQISFGTSADATMDIKWEAEVNRNRDYWQLEMAIPFKYLRYKTGDQWHINFLRNDMGANERSSWSRIPINFLLNNLAFTGRLLWDTTLTGRKKPIAIIPGITMSAAKEKGGKTDMKLRPSVDAKIFLSSAVSMDITVNPDFSQTSADVTQLNLTRFELVYPENRLFFTENSDLFAGFGNASWGNPVVRPFYSRRIGLRYDSTVGGYVPTSIVAGIRSSGKLTPDLRFGVMSIVTKSERIDTGRRYSYIPSQNYSVAAVQQRVFKRSSVAAMFVNRQALGSDTSGKIRMNHADYDRVLALEYNFAAPNDRISGKLYQHTRFANGGKKNEYARGALFLHNTMRWRNWIQLSQVSPGFRPEAGLVPRTNLLDINVQGAYSIYPTKGWLNQVEFAANPQIRLTSKGNYAEHFFIWGIHGISKKTDEVWLFHIQERIKLAAPFDPTFASQVKLDSGFISTFDYMRIFYASDKRQRFFWEAIADGGSYYTGKQVKLQGNLNFRVPPWISIGLNYNISHVSLPKPFSSNTIYYVGPRIDISFTKNLFLTNLVQYSSLSHNVNFYGRFQWRFRQLSDFFIIYSANRDTYSGLFRDNNLIVKANIWL